MLGPNECDHEQADDCEAPCPPDREDCEACIAYWQRMEAEGLWDGSRWTDKGWKDIIRHA